MLDTLRIDADRACILSPTRSVVKIVSDSGNVRSDDTNWFAFINVKYMRARIKGRRSSLQHKTLKDTLVLFGCYLVTVCVSHACMLARERVYA